MLKFVKQVFFLLSMEGSLVDIRAYLALYLGGTPSQETGTRPPSCLPLYNRLYMYTSLSLSHPLSLFISSLLLKKMRLSQVDKRDTILVLAE